MRVSGREKGTGERRKKMGDGRREARERNKRSRDFSGLYEI